MSKGSIRFVLFALQASLLLLATSPIASADPPPGTNLLGSLNYYVDAPGGELSQVRSRGYFTEAGAKMLEQEARQWLQSEFGQEYHGNITTIRDPSTAYNFEFTNITDEIGFFELSYEFELTPLQANTTWGVLNVELIDANGDGSVSLTGAFGDGGAIQGVRIGDSETDVFELMGPALGSDISTPGLHTFTLAPFAGPTPAGKEFVLTTYFNLSPGDTAHITSQFVIDEGTGVPIAQIPAMRDPSEGPYFNVINSPPVIIGDNEWIGSQTQLNVSEGGSVGNNFQAGNFTGGDFDVEMNVSGGTVGTNLLAGSGSVVNISGGVVGGFKASVPDSVVNVSGGAIGTGFISNVVQAGDGGEVNLSGGGFSAGINRQVLALDDGVVNVSGGAFTTANHSFHAHNGSEVNLIGSDFLLDGLPIAGLIAGDPFEILNRNVSLSGLLADGSAFYFDLNDTDLGTGQDYFNPGALLTVTLFAPPTLEADFDQDGDVDGDDFLAWQGGFGTPSGATKSDGDYDNDGDVDGDDFLGWQSEFGSGDAANGAVPEPSAVVLLLVIIGGLALRFARGD